MPSPKDHDATRRRPREHPRHHENGTSKPRGGRADDSLDYTGETRGPGERREGRARKKKKTKSEQLRTAAHRPVDQSETNALRGGDIQASLGNPDGWRDGGHGRGDYDGQRRREREETQQDHEATKRNTRGNRTHEAERRPIDENTHGTEPSARLTTSREKARPVHDPTRSPSRLPQRDGQNSSHHRKQAPLRRHRATPHSDSQPPSSPPHATVHFESIVPTPHPVFT